MKKTTTFIFSSLILICLGLFSRTAYGQDNYGDTLYSVYTANSVYHVEHKGLIHPYIGPLPFIVFGMLFILMGYVIFRYWRDNRQKKNSRSFINKIGSSFIKSAASFAKYNEAPLWY